MASASDIATVRRNVNESTATTYSDDVIGEFIDAGGVAGATAKIWREKAARYASLVNVNESGTSHSYSDLHKNALAMAKAYDVEEEQDVAAPTTSRVVVKKIVRS